MLIFQADMTLESKISQNLNFQSWAISFISCVLITMNVCPWQCAEQNLYYSSLECTELLSELISFYSVVGTVLPLAMFAARKRVQKKGRILCSFWIYNVFTYFDWNYPSSSFISTQSSKLSALSFGVQIVAKSETLKYIFLIRFIITNSIIESIIMISSRRNRRTWTDPDSYEFAQCHSPSLGDSIIFQTTKLCEYGYFKGQNYLNIDISQDKIIQLWIFWKTKLFKYAYDQVTNYLDMVI